MNQFEQRNIKRGDVVLLINERLTRLKWPIDRVEHVILSRDNKARSCVLRLPAEVKMNKGKMNANLPNIVTRGIEQVALLEDDVTQEEVSPLSDNEDNSLPAGHRRSDMLLRKYQYQ